MTEVHVSWDPVQSYLRRVSVAAGPAAGTEEWTALDDNDPAKAYALLLAGSRWVLELDLAQRDHRRDAMKQAAVDISTALPWAQIGREIQQRDAWYAANPDLRRKSA